MTTIRNPQSEPSHPQTEPIAIIGMGCRFPGAKDPEAFWQLLRDGVDAITEVPADRFDIDAVYDARPGVPGKIVTRWGGFLEQVDHFDASFFGLSPREATRMDPQHRLLLEVAWEALADAGQVLDRLAGSQTGVFIGMCYNDYEDLQFSDPASLDIYGITGGFRSVAAGRLSFVLGLQGPSVSVDAACASSLVAVHLACQSLWSGECTLALACGVNLILHPQVSIGFSRARMLSPDGRCKFGDARADGFVRSEGVGVLVLKPLALAQADGDPIHAVIRGSAINDDGRCSGFLMTPSREGQEEVLRQAYQRAGISPGQVHYVEAHGTGTSAGDPIEVQALGAVLSQDRPKDRPCIIGSVKTNIGHTEGAAGLAGLMKVVLALKHRAIPPSLHLQDPNPNIPWQELPLVVQRELGPWPVSAEPARAGVSSFGISGTNAHVVLEEALQLPQSYEETATSTTQPQLLTLSAHSPEALDAMVQAYRAFVAAEAEQPAPPLYDLCYSAGVRRTHHDYRLALVCHNQQELVEHLQAFLRREARPGLSTGHRDPNRQRKLVFVFPGQGAQWLGMGRQLLEQEPVFRDALEQCAQAFQPHVTWSLIEELTADLSQSRLQEVDVVQPTLFAMQVALAALWRAWGIVPDAVVGHSMGEVAAAYIAGALSLADAARIICRRSALVKRTSGQGAMAAVELTLAQAQQALRGYEDRVSVAVSNGPTATVLSGEPAALEAILAHLERQEVFCRLIKVDYASHSPQMEGLRAELGQLLEGLQPRAAVLPIYSTVTGQVSDGQELDATYWMRNLRDPVLFAGTVQRLLEDGHGLFVEISPHPILLPAIQQSLHYLGQQGVVVPSLRREEEERAVLLGSLGALYTQGYPVEWSRLYPTAGRCVPLPAYPWQRERFWLEATPAGPGRRFIQHHGAPGHPLLGEHVASAVHTGEHCWDIELSTDLFPYLQDHCVQDLVILPATVYLELALAAATEAFGARVLGLEQVEFTQALVLPEDASQTLQLVLVPGLPGKVAFQVFSRQSSETDPQAAWTLHASGTIELTQSDTPASCEEHASPAEIQARCVEVRAGVEHYAEMANRGLPYGPSFQGVEQIWRREGEALGHLALPETGGLHTGSYQIHPALLDASFQVLAATLPGGNDPDRNGDTYLPVGVDRLRVYKRPSTSQWSYTRLRSKAEETLEVLEGDVCLLDEAGQVVVEVLGLRLQRLHRDAQQKLDDWLYTMQWQPEAHPHQAGAEALVPPAQTGSWLIFADNDGVGQALQLLLEEHGGSCVVVTPGAMYERVAAGHYHLNPNQREDFGHLLREAFGGTQPSCQGVVYLWSLEAPPPDTMTLAALENAQERGCLSVLHLVQALAGWRDAPRLWLVTRGAQAVGAACRAVAIAHAPLWGLGRTIAYEYPDLRCTLIDLSSEGAPDEGYALFQECWFDAPGEQVALRGDRRYVARLVRRSQDINQTTSPDDPAKDERVLATPDQPYRLEIRTPGMLDGLTLRATTRQEPRPGEVEIQVYATGLNFLDVLKAMGTYPGLEPGAPVTLGAECAGKIVAVGAGVTNVQVGDDVLAITPSFNATGLFSAFVTIPAHLTIPKPPSLSFEEAATIPAVFLTAYYALHYLGRLAKGERILIHTATGGVGLAAVQLARWLGAEIFATAGSEEKRQFLRSLGIQHVMDSRSLDFAQEVLEWTNGEGVDVVLNSLTGVALSRSLAILKPYGRFLEIGKRDIYQNSPLGLEPFKKNLSFFAIDLARMIEERPAFVTSLLHEVLQHFVDGTFKPLPLCVFPIGEVVDAFRYMAQAKHIGKIVLTLHDQEVHMVPREARLALLRADGTYLITGGLGGLGLRVAQWLVQQGARHLVLLGRRGASAAAQAALDSMAQAGAQVVVAQADVAQESHVARVLFDIEQHMPPLRGIIHAAAVLDDGLLLHLTPERFQAVLAPKMDGAWNLHTLTVNTPLDFFVLFSSAASMLGSPGQGNYVAANAFLDALAHHRRTQGLPALSINWGPWAEVGLAAAQAKRGERLALRGLGSLTPEQGVEALGKLLHQESVQVAVMPFNVRQWCQFYPQAAASLLLAQAVQEQSSASRAPRHSRMREELLALEPGPKRRTLLESHLQEQIAQVLRISTSRLDRQMPLNTMGLDSLMTLELRNLLEVSLGVTLSATFVWGYPTIAALAPHLAGKMGVELEAIAENQTEEPINAWSSESEELDQQILEDIEKLSEEEVRRMLAEGV